MALMWVHEQENLKPMEDKMLSIPEMLNRSGMSGMPVQELPGPLMSIMDMTRADVEAQMQKMQPEDPGDLMALIGMGKEISGGVNVSDKVRALETYRAGLIAVGMTRMMEKVDREICLTAKRQKLMDYKYILITEENIKDFLKRKSSFLGVSVWDRLEWDEKPLEQSEHLPPATVVEAIKVHQDRNVFDYMTIASVREVKDPIVFGRLTGSKDRFFIAQWGDDVCLDDLI